jgi:serine-type D-Ala-D-Ala carboxypeptidase/endopeptidase (penicillin-binding protein 4)
MRLRALLLLCAAAVVTVSGVMTLGQRTDSAPVVTEAQAAVPNIGFAPDPLPKPVPRQPEAEPPAAQLPATVIEPLSEPQPGSLAERLTTALDHPALAGSRLGVTVVDPAGTTVFDRSGDHQLTPASTQKLLVAAAALVVLGPEHRYVTTVQAAAVPGADGVLHGDLVLVGSGDPALATPQFGAEVYPQRPRTPLEALADQIVAAGVTRVTGGVLGDPSFFPHDPIPPGWPTRYLTELNGTYSAGLTVDAGRKMFVRNGKLQAEAAPDPAAEAAAALYTLLGHRGVQIDGGVSSTTGIAAGVPLATVHSPPMRELLRHTVQRSDNHMADAIFRTLGAVAGDGTWAGAQAALRAALSPLNLEWAGSVQVDGSGLSRSDRLTPRMLVQLDRALSGSELVGEWEPLMAVTGHSGTLRLRLRGTVAHQAMRGKTGLLQDVRALSGAVDGPRGRYFFAVIGNDLDRPARNALREVTDDLVLLLAEDLRGCTRIPLPPPADDAPPAYELDCAA